MKHKKLQYQTVKPIQTHNFRILNKIKSATYDCKWLIDCLCRGDKIRTCDHTPPRRVL